MVEENGSVRGRECVARISSPVRMCHPISGSASGRFDKGPASNDQKRKMKMMSRTEGRRKRRGDELGWAEGIKDEEAVYKVSKTSGDRAIGSSGHLEPRRAGPSRDKAFSDHPITRCLVAKIANPHPHVVQQAVRHGQGNG